VQRFFALHFMLPFMLIVILVMHLALLHVFGSGCAGGVLGSTADMDHFGLFYYKDVFVILLGSALLGILIMVFSDSLHHADNFLAVDRFVTPRHIVPEWYFLAWYSVLRSCSSKLIGVILLLFGVLQFMFMVGVGHGSKASTSACEGVESTAVLMLLCILGLLGGCMPVFPYVELSGTLSAVYF